MPVLLGRRRRCSRRWNWRCANPTDCSRSAAISRVPRLLAAYRHGIFPVVFARASRSCGGRPIRAWCSAPTAACGCRRGSVAGCGSRRGSCAPTRASKRSSTPARPSRARASAARGSCRRCAAPTARCIALGHAHSIEVFDGERLVGGLYGVAVGAMFFAESMFSAESGGSKVALAALAHRLREWGWPLIDAQVENDAPRRAWAPNHCRAPRSCASWRAQVAAPVEPGPVDRTLSAN